MNWEGLMITEDKHRSLEDRVLYLLREEILSGELAPGTPLTEISLSTRLGVSRTPLRSAIHRLSEEGLVRSGTNRGAVVVGITGEDVDDIYCIRMRLEGLAARLAAKDISEEGLSHLTDLVELSEFYVNKGKYEKLRELDGEFHERIYAECNNRPLKSTLSQLHNKIKLYREISLSVPGRLERSVTEHAAILEAIKAGDGDLADRLTTEHIEAAYQNIKRALEEKKRKEEN